MDTTTADVRAAQRAAGAGPPRGRIVTKDAIEVEMKEINRLKRIENMNYDKNNLNDE